MKEDTTTLLVTTQIHQNMNASPRSNISQLEINPKKEEEDNKTDLRFIEDNMIFSLILTYNLLLIGHIASKLF